MNHICKECSNHFVDGFGNFCSRKCYERNWHKTHYVNRVSECKCSNCGKIFQGDSKRKYCSKQCLLEFNKLRKSEREPRKTICKGCAGEFISMHRSKFYCTDECRAKNRKKRVVKIPCRKCGNLFIKSQRGRFYCSPECKPKITLPLVKIECAECKNTFIGRNNYKYCSERCRRRRHDRRKAKFINDGIVKVCEFCGFSDNRAVHAHHINSSDEKKTMFLCANHHYIYHSILGITKLSENKTREEVLEVLRSA